MIVILWQDGAVGARHHGRSGGSRHRGAVRAEGRPPVLRRSGGTHPGAEPQLQQVVTHDRRLHPTQELPGNQTRPFLN